MTPDNSSDYYVHPSSYVDEGAEIGSQSQIWHFCHVMSTARVGRECKLGQNVFIGSNVLIGNGVKIQNNVSLFEGVVIKDDVFIGPSAVFTNVRNPRSEVNRQKNYQTTVIERGASLGANCTILCGVEIGQYAFVGAGAVVTTDVPDYALVAGNPAKQMGWMSRMGEKLAFDDTNTARCGVSNDVYKMDAHGKVYLSNGDPRMRTTDIDIASD